LLSKHYRLTLKADFKRFFENSEIFRTSQCTIFRVPNSLGHFRLGITLKARGTSPQRNKVKRKVRESFRRNATKLGSFDYNVLIPAHKKLAHPYPEKLEEALEKLFNDRQLI
jgi:ribonuclease P protein component